MSNNVIIVGGGPAGYTAAIYAGRAGLKPLLLEGPRPGGQLTITTTVENYPGFSKGIEGPALMDEMRAQAIASGATIEVETVTGYRRTHDWHIVTNERGELAQAKSLIIATGASAKWLGIPGEDTYMHKGITACATCDGPLLSRFLGRSTPVAVIGGGDTACEEALYLTGLFDKVYLVHRRLELRASSIMQGRCAANRKIEHVLMAKPLEFVGDGEKLGGIELELQHAGKPKSRLEVGAAFVAIGHAPATRFLEDTDVALGVPYPGYIDTLPGSTEVRRRVSLTTERDEIIPGLFAAGDCVDDKYRQAVTAAGMGCQAAIQAERWLRTQE
jgi:thioredoxin reductase (NADPH)